MRVFKFLSRAVHEEQEESEHVDGERNKYLITEASLCTSLTVWRKSLLLSCKGFTVIDSYGNLVYRVDNYILHPHQLILMDASGKCVLTVRRQRRFGLVDSWFVYKGEMGDQRTRSKFGESSESPFCCVRKRVNILNGNPKVQACVYRVASDSDKRHTVFTVEGSYAHRTCKVLDECKRAVAEIKRKEANSKDVSFGIEIFQLIVHPGFDPGFAMALVLLLDQMFS
ncbi:protein LURP-one-related 17-like [Gastrolobium bilobum]|uniref:protein LURP-one-related 17-like n=1 Tax=Gastrolobium bilobum TaxID=150636 RepID=UPI002AB05877|nr:protein LURP-one-related 17-like [Gastrolobium bilobum]